MPYIKQARRDELAEVDGIASPDVAGELNYEITKLITTYVDQHGLNYQRINDVVGALEGAKLEFYRRVAAPYENDKIKENGDIPYYADWNRGRM